MQIKTYIADIYEANCYVVCFDHFALIIDPCVSLNQIKDFIGNLPVKGIFITHGHADHFFHLDQIKKYYQAPIYCHPAAKEKIGNWKKNYSFLIRVCFSLQYEASDYILIKEGNVVIEGKTIGILETPGHSDCSLSYIIEDALFTGDTLFYRSIGRVDLQTSSSQAMKMSLAKLATLDKDYFVYPGHDQTTMLYDEIKHNRYMRKQS